MFFVGLQEEMVVSSLLLLRMMDVDAGAVGTLDTAQMRAFALALPRERSTIRSTRQRQNPDNISISDKIIVTTALADEKVLVNGYSSQLHKYLMTDASIGKAVSTSNTYDLLLYSYGKHMTICLYPMFNLTFQPTLILLHNLASAGAIL